MSDAARGGDHGHPVEHDLAFTRVGSLYVASPHLVIPQPRVILSDVRGRAALDVIDERRVNIASIHAVTPWKRRL